MCLLTDATDMLQNNLYYVFQLKIFYKDHLFHADISSIAADQFVFSNNGRKLSALTCTDHILHKVLSQLT